MPTECSAAALEFIGFKGRLVMAAFDCWSISSDAGALLLGETDRALGLVKRFAACFRDRRKPDLIEHDVRTLAMQRVFGIALGYEDLIDHNHMCHDPAMACADGEAGGLPRGLRAAGWQTHAKPAGVVPSHAVALSQDQP